jgi:NAD(P)-dependent dehydrogenase (short-subunit alcohol dehydrogenase family)
MTATVLITGASEGIGKETALLFASKGYDTILAARNAETLEATAIAVRKLGRQALAIPTDVTDLEQLKTLVAKAIATYGQIDVLVNNAGIYLNAPITAVTLEDWQKIINTNLWGYVCLIHLLLPHFLARQQGTIVNVGSIGGKLPAPNMVPYCTSKYAITGLTESLRLELEPRGIRVCGVYPNLTDSNFLKRAIFRGENEQQQDKQRQQIETILKTPFVSKPEDVAKEIWHVVKENKAEAIVGLPAVGAAAMHRLFPGLTDWFMKRGTGLVQ